jgi:hypothetical protein
MNGKAVKKPIPIEWWNLKDEKPKWVVEAFEDGIIYELDEDILKIKTSEGVVSARKNYDFILRGIHGELYPCKITVFTESYNILGSYEINNV